MVAGSVKFEPAVKALIRPAPAVFLAVVPLLLLLPITHDAIWQIWVGRQLLGGAELYRDIIEVNPPLWFWTAVPLAAFGGDARVTIILFFVAAIGLSLYLTPERERLALLAVLVIVPLHGFGQREHFTLIASAPYVFAIAARAKGDDPKHVIAIGLFAAFGLCLKPYFLLLPLALELLVWRERRARPETVSLASFTLVYGLSIPIFAPAYLTDAIPHARQFYGAFAKRPDYAALILALIVAGIGAIGRKGSPESRALLLASLAFLPAVLIQARGFAYHSIPVRGFLCLAILVELSRPRRLWSDALLAGAAILCCHPFGVYRNEFRAETERHLAGLPKGTSIIVLSSNPRMAWPMIDEHGLDWKLRGLCTWQTHAVLNDPSLLPDARRIAATALAQRPDILIIDRRPVWGKGAQALIPSHYLDGYRPRLRTARMESYQRVKM